VSAPRIAALLTCHNRRDRTLALLASLNRQMDVDLENLEVVVVDAGSTDGTPDAVEAALPRARVIRRGPDLFWNGGMRVAISEAYELDPDFYLWLNDDVLLDEHALATLLSTHRSLTDTRRCPCIVVGSTRDPETGEFTYGGVVRRDRLRPLRYDWVPPADIPQPVETMNGNCVLVPREVVASIGSLSAAYTHGMGDFDYGHRTTRAGGEVWIAPGTIGSCSRNATPPPAASLNEHRRRTTSPKTGLPPAEWLLYARRWAGPLWPLYGLSPYVRRSWLWFIDR
jgi:GT2 family glycosyltransferase